MVLVFRYSDGEKTSRSKGKLQEDKEGVNMDQARLHTGHSCFNISNFMALATAPKGDIVYSFLSEQTHAL